LFNGTLGESNGGIFYRTESASSSFLLESVSFIFPALMFLFILAIGKRFKRNNHPIGNGIHTSA
jgi:hypothetical protein